MPSSASFSLDALASFEDRSALVALVQGQLAPPIEAVETFVRLRRDAIPQQSIDPLTARALIDQMDWVNRELLGLMAVRIHSMLEWCSRLKVVEPSKEWSPEAWVRAAQAMGCEATLVEALVTSAPTVSWPAWRQALRVDENWAAKWQGWSRAFEKSPAPALRWLDEFLVKPEAQSEEDWKTLLGAYRGRLALQIFLCQEREWPARSLQGLEKRLEKAGAPCLLEAIDFSSLFKEGDQVIAPGIAQDRLKRFLLSRPDEAKAWLEKPEALAKHGLKIDPQAKPARVWAFLNMLGHHRVAGSHDLELVFQGLSHASFGGSDWARVIGPSTFEALGAKRPLPPKVAKKKAVKKTAKKLAVSPSIPVSQSLADAPDLGADAVKQKYAPAPVPVPRFPRRA